MDEEVQNHAGVWIDRQVAQVQAEFPLFLIAVFGQSKEVGAVPAYEELFEVVAEICALADDKDVAKEVCGYDDGDTNGKNGHERPQQKTAVIRAKRHTRDSQPPAGKPDLERLARLYLAQVLSLSVV